MRAPDFWKTNGILPTLLRPASWVFRLAGELRQRCQSPQRIDAPVICIGNLTAGGSGKTPTVIALARRLSELGYRPAAVSKGYGGRLKGPILVDTNLHGYRDVGDEALLLARVLPTWIAKDRADGAKSAASAGADVILLDDGFQNNSLYKDLNIVVIDGGYGFGNGAVIPAGPLREPKHTGLTRADGIIVIGSKNKDLMKDLNDLGKPICLAQLIPPSVHNFYPGERVYGFAGIGRPAKFAETLIEMGLELTGFKAFPDHHVYRADEIMSVIEDASDQSARPVTTEKDAVRLPKEARSMVETLPITLQFENEACIADLLHSIDRH